MGGGVLVPVFYADFVCVEKHYCHTGFTFASILYLRAENGV